MSFQDVFLFALMQKETKKSRRTDVSGRSPGKRLSLCDIIFSFTIKPPRSCLLINFRSGLP
jgi:hypothetical protein